MDLIKKARAAAKKVVKTAVLAIEEAWSPPPRSAPKRAPPERRDPIFEMNLKEERRVKALVALVEHEYEEGRITKTARDRKVKAIKRRKRRWV